MGSSALPWERIRKAQLHTVASLHSQLLLYPTQFVIERLHPQFIDTYIKERSKLTTFKAGICVLFLSFSPIVGRLILPPDPNDDYTLSTRSFLMVCVFCGPLITLAARMGFQRKLREKSFEVAFFGYAKSFLPALFYNGLGPQGEPTWAKYILQEAYQWEHDLLGSSDLVVLSMSMAVMVFVSTSVAGSLAAYSRGLLLGIVIGLVLTLVSLILLNSVLGASSELQSYVDAELKAFEPHWKILGYRSDLSSTQVKDENLQAAVIDAAELFERLAAEGHSANPLDERLDETRDEKVYSKYLLEAPFDAKVASRLQDVERRGLQQLARRIREEGVEVLRRLVLWLHRHSNELTSSQKACWKLFKAESKCSMEVFACDEYALAVLSLLDIATFLGVFCDSRQELLPKIGWKREHILKTVFIASPQQFLYELDTKSKGDAWCLRASLDTYQADKHAGEPHSE